MRRKHLFYIAVIALASCTGIAAQDPAAAAESAVREVKKGLANNSRVQIQSITMVFKPLEFKTCKIEYTFERLGSIGNENFGQATVERGSNTAVAARNTTTTSTTMSSVTGNTAAVVSNNNPSFNMSESSFYNSGRITTFDLADIEPNSVAWKKLTDGVFIGFRTVDNKKLIQRHLKGQGTEPEPSSIEFIPIVSEKKAEEIKTALIQAINACKAAR
ncbi:MAG: hypothetical protein KF736_10805 [Acidobacteria bacterium]|nr:hypothetical protein [Acidobacteriota bacterium]MCW5949613.1 hypothetical protein [Pyrinomonadaceae bacterium]